MAKEEVFLPVQMERLEIEPLKVPAATSDDNPFLFRRNSLPKRSPPSKCPCKKSIKTKTSFKRNNSKLLKEPVLKFIHSCCQYGGEGKALASLSTVAPKARIANENNEQKRSPLQTLNLETLNVCALVENCNPLSSSPPFSEPNFMELQRPQVRETTAMGSNSSMERNRVAGPTCSQQALNPTCDITIDELASYFETLVHIPKKMSTMAEMMYI